MPPTRHPPASDRRTTPSRACNRLNQIQTPSSAEHAIAQLLGIPETRYYPLLNELIDRPEVLADPALSTGFVRNGPVARRHAPRPPSALTAHPRPSQARERRPGRPLDLRQVPRPTPAADNHAAARP